MKIDEDKVKKALKKIGLDALGIGICVFAASEVPRFIPLLKGAELVLSCSAGIWLYVPLRNFINNIIRK